MEILPQELAARINSSDVPKLLDVREPEEHELAALPNSKLIPLGQLSVRASEISSWKSDEIVVYCHHGIRSRHAIQFLQQLGFERLLNLSGGIDQWSVQIDPTVPRY
ncbi:MAG: sulfurtransferase [Verrucomicrobiales bacterium]|jgi:rhodanese-related sulfurtransferase|nr:sulfurtransferase [Verrucomicrobiales bacterium]